VVLPGLVGARDVAAGRDHGLAVRSDGTVTGWGTDWGYGSTTPPEGLGDVVAVAAGTFHSLALRADGTVEGWGHNEYGKATPPPGLGDVVAIAAGHDHSLALRADGTIVTWGAEGWRDAQPQLRGVVAVDADSSQSLALLDDGSIVAWAPRHYQRQPAPPPTGLSRVTAIVAGTDHALALRAVPPSAPRAVAARAVSTAEAEVSFTAPFDGGSPSPATGRSAARARERC
jgi:hypothetical protein